MSKILTIEGQTLQDICLQHYGSFNALEELIELNAEKIDTVDKMLEPGTELEIGEPIEQDLVNYYKAEGVEIVSGLYEAEAGVDNGVFATEFGIEFE